MKLRGRHPQSLGTLRRPDSQREQAGAILVLFCLLLFALFGLAALTVDLGMARATQASMQNAVDSAAIEGLRGRDLPHAYGGLGTDFKRRNDAARMVHRTFDEDLDYLGENEHIQLGMGPMVRVEDGIGEDNVLGTLVVDQDEKVYTPHIYDQERRLEINVMTNLPFGDIVSGNYNVNDPFHTEAPDYERSDFKPSSAGDYNDKQNRSLLVRLRRTGGDGVDDMDDVSSSGPTLPFLFGLGSTIHRDRNSAYNPRRDGISVRATAIATEKNVLKVGVFDYYDIGEGRPIPGVLRIGRGVKIVDGIERFVWVTFGVTEAQWEAWVPATDPDPCSWTQGDPSIRSVLVQLQVNPNQDPCENIPLIDYFDPGSGFPVPLGPIVPLTERYVGAPGPAFCGIPGQYHLKDVSMAALTEVKALWDRIGACNLRLYVPIFKRLSGFGSRVHCIGFGSVDLVDISTHGSGSFTLRKLQGQMAPMNASPRSPRSLRAFNRIPGLHDAYMDLRHHDALVAPILGR